MSRVDFYLLDSSHSASRYNLACRLTEKAYRTNNRIHIRTRNSEQAALIDKLLWTFRAGSFIPHRILSSTSCEISEPVAIGSLPEALPGFSLVINLDDEPAAAGYERIIEIVDRDEPVKQAGRKRYRHYQSRGDTLSTHKIQV